MTSDRELYVITEMLAKCVSDKSSEDDKITVLVNIKPSSFAWVIECILDYIDQHGE